MRSRCDPRVAFFGLIGAVATAAVLAVLGAPGFGAAQPLGKAPRIGMLTPAFDELAIGGRVKIWLTERGWREGETHRFESRTALGGDTQLGEFAAELARLPVDVLVTSGLLATRAAKRATTTVPIIFGVEGDPVREGLVQSLARPGET